MKCDMWLTWKQKNRPFPLDRDILNPKDIYPILYTIEEFNIKGLGRLRVDEVSQYPSNVHSDKIYINIKCSLMEGIGI